VLVGTRAPGAVVVDPLTPLVGAASTVLTFPFLILGFIPNELLGRLLIIGFGDGRG
jgi:hypothetical protein